MKALRIAIGLVFDDAWLFGGVIVSAALGFVIALAGARTIAGIIFLLGVLASLWVSSVRGTKRS